MRPDRNVPSVSSSGPGWQSASGVLGPRLGGASWELAPPLHRRKQDRGTRADRPKSMNPPHGFAGKRGGSYAYENKPARYDDGQRGNEKTREGDQSHGALDGDSECLVVRVFSTSSCSAVRKTVDPQRDAPKPNPRHVAQLGRNRCQIHREYGAHHRVGRANVLDSRL